VELGCWVPRHVRVGLKCDRPDFSQGSAAFADLRNLMNLREKLVENSDQTSCECVPLLGNNIPNQISPPDIPIIKKFLELYRKI
jgi:hypothetical protein